MRGARASMSGARATMSGARAFDVCKGLIICLFTELLMIINMEGVFIAHSHLVTFEKGGKEQLPEGSGFIFIFFVYQKSEICLQF